MKKVNNAKQRLPVKRLLEGNQNHNIGIDRYFGLYPKQFQFGLTLFAVCRISNSPKEFSSKHVLTYVDRCPFPIRKPPPALRPIGTISLLPPTDTFLCP